jgi:aldehyde dehydrogenase (NAD+)
MYHELLNLQRTYFNQGKTKDYQFRMKQLDALYQVITTHENLIIEALYQDLGKSSFEAYLTEIGVVKKEIKDMKKHLKSYMKLKRVEHWNCFIQGQKLFVPRALWPSVIIAPWNYPFQLGDCSINWCDCCWKYSDDQGE